MLQNCSKAFRTYTVPLSLKTVAVAVRKFRRRPPPCSSSSCRRFAAIADRRHHGHDRFLLSSSVPSKIVDVTELAEQMRAEVREYTSKSKEPIRLAGLLAVDAMPDLEDAEIYSNHIAERLKEDGIEYEHVFCRGYEPEDVEAAIEEMNNRKDVHGILVYYPIFRKRSEEEHDRHQRKHGPYMNAKTGVYYKSYDDYLRDVVSPEKDVEGLSSNYNSRWYFRTRGFTHRRKKGEIYIPCTALAVGRILEAYHVFPTNTNATDKTSNQQWLDTTATVINRSEIMGRPLAAMLALKGADVYSVDENSILLFRHGGKMRRCNEPHIDLDWCLAQSSIVVTGVPSSDFQLSAHSIATETATIVNVSEFSNVDEESIMERPGISYIPKVGKITVAALEQNLISLHQRSKARWDS